MNVFLIHMLIMAKYKIQNDHNALHRVWCAKRVAVFKD